ncbi:hypothetical protein L596_022270 [Steinernema carpocapsae]|uniref:RING-type domain-containing protein n=1 Tax=Steinernema carpocapsae TaxID=34508 RepID=A0A4U5ML67_STECR|nr:hypothetical protein L596_022270 [Steinernema carpocapsae]
MDQHEIDRYLAPTPPQRGELPPALPPSGSLRTPLDHWTQSISWNPRTGFNGNVPPMPRSLMTYPPPRIRYRRGVQTPSVRVFGGDDSSGISSTEVNADASDPQSETPNYAQNPLFNDDALKCPICYDIFNIPKILVCCGRSICQACEDGHRNAGNLHGNCPVCSSPRSFDRAPLQVNVALRNTIELLKESHQNAKNTAKCQECEKEMKVDEVYFCSTCDSMKQICCHCALKNHKSHEVAELTYVKKEVRETMIKSAQLLSTDSSIITSAPFLFNTLRDNWDKCVELNNENLRKAKQICADIVNNDYLTEDVIKAKIEEAKKYKNAVKDAEIRLSKHIMQLSTIDRDLRSVQTSLTLGTTTDASEQR